MLPFPKKHGTGLLIIQLQSWSVYIKTVDTCLYTYVLKQLHYLKVGQLVALNVGSTRWPKKVPKSYNTGSIASILKIWLGLDRWDFKLNYDTTNVHFTPLLSY